MFSYCWDPAVVLLLDYTLLPYDVKAPYVLETLLGMRQLHDSYPSRLDSAGVCCELHHELPWAYEEIPHPLVAIESFQPTLLHGIFRLVMSTLCP